MLFKVSATLPEPSPMVYLTSADGFVFPADGLEIPADDFVTIGNAFACLTGGSAPLLHLYRYQKLGIMVIQFEGISTTIRRTRAR